ncbi:MAG: ComEC/Rec2 family competence protein [Deltaproteobacteria bacterium]|nr:ComEC/Rec2 family competence protein [Deltaproteobacteria bacterium]
MLGQAAAYLLAGLKLELLCCVGLALCVCVYLMRSLRLLVISFVLGVLSSALAILGMAHVDLRPDRSYLVEVLREPQRPRSGEVRFALAALAEVSEEGRIVREFSKPPRLFCRAVDLPWKNSASQFLGAQFVVRARFHALSIPSYPLSYEATLFRHGFTHTCKIIYATASLNSSSRPAIARLRAYLKKRVFAVLGDGERSGILLAMSLGMRDMISDETENAFKVTGLAHLLVASGYQVTLLFFTLCWIAARVVAWFPSAQALQHWNTIVTLVGLLGSALFVALVGIEGSVVRAMFAILFVMSGRIFERNRAFTNSILISLLLVSLLWPGCYFEPGIQLTFAALWGLAMAADSSAVGKVRQYLLACLYACIGTSAVSLAWFGRISLWTFLLNPIMAPLGALLGCKAVLSALVFYVCGIDPWGVGLQMLGVLLEYYRDAVFLLANVAGFSFELEGIARAAVLSMLGLLWAWLVFRSTLRYCREFNIAPVARSEKDMQIY